MRIHIAQLARRSDFEFVRDRLVSYGIDTSTLSVVGAHSDAPAPQTDGAVMASLRELHKGSHDSEGQLPVYAQLVLEGGAIMRIELDDDRQADLIQDLVYETYDLR